MSINQVLTLCLIAIVVVAVAISWIALGLEMGLEFFAVCQNVPGGDVCRISL